MEAIRRRARDDPALPQILLVEDHDCRVVRVRLADDVSGRDDVGRTGANIEPRKQDRPERRQLALLLSSQLGSNAARYRSDEVGLPIEVTAEAEGEQLRVTFHEQGSGFDPLTVTKRSGELRLVDRTSSRWGVEQTESGSDIWFEIRAGRGSFQRRITPKITRTRTTTRTIHNQLGISAHPSHRAHPRRLIVCLDHPCRSDRTSPGSARGAGLDLPVSLEGHPPRRHAACPDRHLSPIVPQHREEHRHRSRRPPQP